MDVAYDHITEENLSPEDTPAKEHGEQQAGSLNAELQEAYKTITTSPWGARLGGFLGTVRKQGESYYQGAKKEAAEIGDEAMKMGDEAFKGFTDLKSTLVSRARSLSVNEQEAAAQATQEKKPNSSDSVSAAVDAKSTTTPRSDSDALGDSDGLLTRFKAEAAKRLKDIERAEDAADEALLKFGANIRNFLRDAVSVTPPPPAVSASGSAAQADSVLFESKDADGKRVFHTTRFDAQLHVIHTSSESLARDPASPEFAAWAADFDAARRTAEIAADLDRFEELRRAMERLVPETVDYETFWKRYYFLRMVIESEEAKRKEMLTRAALSPTEEVGWDEDSDSEPGTPQPRNSTSTLHAPIASSITAATTTTPTTSATTSTSTTFTSEADATPKPSRPTTSAAEPRKSQDQNSQADSDASYDVVSGAPSVAPGSPVEDERKRIEQQTAATKVGKPGVAESDEEEEDWE